MPGITWVKRDSAAAQSSSSAAATVEAHKEATGSQLAERLLDQWESEVEAFCKVMPKDYRRVLAVLDEAARLGLSQDDTDVMVMESAHG